MKPTQQRLRDALAAAQLIHEAIQGKTADSYVDDPWFRSAVHFQLAIIGEAFNQVRRNDPNLTIEFGAISEWISLRSIVIHAYGGIDYDLIWTTITKEIPELIVTLERLLNDDAVET